MFLGTVGCIIVLLYNLVNLVSGWQCGVAVNTGNRLYPRFMQERSMRINSDLKEDFIEKNTLAFKMDSCKQKLYQEILKEEHDEQGRRERRISC